MEYIIPAASAIVVAVIEAQPNNRKTHDMNSMPFGQCRICPEMYILLYSPLYLITKNGVPKDIKFGLMEEFG